VVVLCILVIFGGVGAVAFWKYHEEPQFLGTFCIMDRYLETWRSADYGAGTHAQCDIKYQVFVP
jgi:hypothetical protein